MGGGGEVMTLVVDFKHRGCFSCYVEIDVIMGGVGGGGGEVMTLVVDCKHRGCFSCYVEIDVIMGWVGGGCGALFSAKVLEGA